MAVADEPVARRAGVTPSSIWNSYCSRRQPVLRDEPQAFRDQQLVVRRDPTYDPHAEQLAEAEDEVLAHLLEVPERDQRRLDVDALAEAHVRLVGRQLADVPDRPAQVGLEDDADVVEPGLAQLAVHAERVARAARVLHVDPDEVAALRGMADDRLEVRVAELVREVQPQPGQLDADVRVEVLPLDRLEDVVVGADDLERLLGGC